MKFDLNKVYSEIASSTVIIAGLTCLAYICSLLFEIGYLNRFGINYQSARVTTEGLIVFGVVFTFIMVWFYESRGLFWSMLKPKTKPKDVILRYVVWRARSLGLFILWAIPLMLYYQKLNWIIWIIGIGIFAGFTDIFIDGAGVKGVRNKILKLVDVRRQNDNSDNPHILIAFFAITFIFSVSLYSGSSWAFHRTTYKVVNKNMIVVREYNDQIILAEFDTKSKKLTGNYEYSSKNNNKVSFKVEKMQNLHYRQ